MNTVQYKYQLNIDGTVAAYRFPYLLAGDSVVLKQNSPFYEHFYKQLKPMHHYIPIERDLSDLVDKLDWAKRNDQKVKQMSDQAQQFANQYLTPDNVLCYHVKLFKVKLKIFSIQSAQQMDPLKIIVLFYRSGVTDWQIGLRFNLVWKNSREQMMILAASVNSTMRN